MRPLRVIAAGDGPARFLRRRGWIATTVAAAGILAYQILTPPVVGLANNGDFEKIMGTVGLRYPPGTTEDARYYRFIQTKFLFARPWWNSGYRTSESLLVRSAMLPAKMAGGGVFDIRWLGGLHAALFLLFFGSIVRSLARKGGPSAAAVALAALLFFTDVGYAAPMNSMYGQEASFLGLFGLFAVLAAAWQENRFAFRHATAYYAAAAFFVASKPQESVQAAILAGFGVWMTMPTGGGVRLAGLAGAGALLALGVWCWADIPGAMKEASVRKVVFREILPRSPEPRGDLAAMRLDPELATRSPESLADDPAIQREIAARLSRGRLLLFLAAHPGRALGLALPTARAAMVLRPPAFGNLPSGAGYREREPSRAFSAWSSIRAAAAPAGPIVLAVLFGGSAMIGGRGLRRGGNALGSKAVLLVAALGIVAFFVCALGSSSVERERHLFSFDATTDALLALAVGAGVGRLAGRMGFARG